MSFISFAIEQVIHGPNEISEYALKLAFDNPISGIGTPYWDQLNVDSNYNITQGIREKVIYKMIAPLLNVAGGVTEVIDLSTSRVKYMGNGDIHVNVPDSKTGGREILSVIGVYPGTLGSNLLYGTNTQSANCGTGGAEGASMGRVLNNLGNTKAISTFTNTSRTGRNSFLIRGAGVVVYNMVAKVLLTYDEEFSILPPKSYPYFSQLTVLGTKAYIYKHCRRGLKESVRRYGYSLDELQDEIDSYSDAHREFMELYEYKIRKVLAYADTKGCSDMLAMTTPRRIG